MAQDQLQRIGRGESRDIPGRLARLSVFSETAAPILEKLTNELDLAGASAMGRPALTRTEPTGSALSTRLSPDELKQLAEARTAQAMRIEAGPERLRVLTVADALINLAEIKKLQLKYERRLLH
jgi:hypothetical protein